MTWEVFGHNIFLIVAVSFLVSAFLVPVAKKIAFHIGAVDKPNKRRVNKVEMPTQGGLAIFASFLLCFMLFVDMNTQMFSILIGSFVIIITGMIDGINPIKARHKMLAQIIAASIIVFYGGIYLTEITLPGIYLLLPTTVNQIISIVFIVGIINAINLIDGLDGLCAGVSSIYFLTIAIIAFTLNMLGGLDIILSLIMFGATLGFLFHNFPPAKIYLGDTGSMFLGYIISVIALLGFKVTTLTSLIVPISILAIPIFDTAMAILRRLLNGKKIGEPDKEHFHHQLLKLKFTPRVSVLIIYAINIVFATVSILFVLHNRQIAVFIYTLLLLLLLFLVLKTDILFDHSKKKEVKNGIQRNGRKNSSKASQR